MNDLQALRGVSHLAFELAVELRPVADICQQFNIAPADLAARLRSDAQLRNQIRACRDEWNSSLSAEDRVRIKAAIMAEDGLLDLWRAFSDPDAGPSIRLAIHQHLSKLGNVQTPPLEAQPGSRFSVSINIPPPADNPNARPTRLDIDATALPEPSGSGGTNEVGT